VVLKYQPQSTVSVIKTFSYVCHLNFILRKFKTYSPLLILLLGYVENVTFMWDMVNS
jgi:hypothetical protein